ncbi:MAG: NrfD/PsrC family molybdoenzyme membrane anchor subunit [Candidatus Acidiferrales bacterium]|jgi:formate-dependent nitrite reductase membrane component NrfD
MEIVPQAVWRWKIAAYLFLAGTGAGAVIVGILGDFVGYVIPAKIAIAFGVPAVALSTLFLIADLGRPAKFFRAMLHPGTSWISRGFFIVSALIVSGGFTVILWVWPFGSVLDADQGLRTALEVIALVFAVATCIYTGILIGVVVSRPFWNNPLLPILFLISAVSTGIGGVFFITPIVCSVLGIASPKTAEFVGHLESVDMILVIAEAIAIYLYLALVFDRAPEAARLLLTGKLSGLFWGGFLGAGLLVPMVIEFFSSVGHAGVSPSLAPLVAGLFLLVGGFLMRLLILAAGIRSPLILRTPFRVRPGF